MNNIFEKQNDDKLLHLLKASTVAYSKAKKGEMTVTYFSFVLAVAYPIAYLLLDNENVKFVLFVCSFFLTLAIQLLTHFFKGNTTKGALIKEEFDTILFNLPWKSTLEKIEGSEILALAKQYKGNEIRNWYSPNISANIPTTTIIAIMQHSNTSWDIKLREMFSNYLIALLLLYTFILLVLFVYINSTAITIFLLMFSVLSFYTHFIAIISGHYSAIVRRKALSRHLDIKIQGKKKLSFLELRDIQDEIFISRQESAKVPNFFFRIYKKKMSAIDEDYIQMVNSIYK